MPAGETQRVAEERPGTGENATRRVLARQGAPQLDDHGARTTVVRQRQLRFTLPLGAAAESVQSAPQVSGLLGQLALDLLEAYCRMVGELLVKQQPAKLELAGRLGSSIALTFELLGCEREGAARLVRPPHIAQRHPLSQQ